ncbi:transcriptional regulator [Oecophyllibacter saccharovorans]|uniref:Transcriptional regulator n=1 Tax=Oecophyllibacter saccharovorans TaxID=2558360 RepID=A0A506ULP4_9PROT|nr:transcriptional regulator [Oecophyllibacter saccharovorans]
MSGYFHPELENVEISQVLRALAEPVRMNIVMQLHELGTANCTTLLGKRPKSSMSHHFQVLRESGLIRTEIQGIQHFNSLRRAELDKRFPGLMQAILNCLEPAPVKETRSDKKAPAERQPAAPARPAGALSRAAKEGSARLAGP